MSTPRFIEYIREILEPYGVNKIRSMFGGFGVYKDNKLYAIIAYNELYFKADDETAEFFQSFGSTPFIYKKNNKVIKMSYWKVLPEVLEDPLLLKQWQELAYNSSITANKNTRSKKKSKYNRNSIKNNITFNN